MLYRFAVEVQIGDYIVFPSKSDRKINIGRIESESIYAPDAKQYVHQRKVTWLKHIPRTAFSQGALYEIGSALTFFSVKNYADEYLQALDKGFKPTVAMTEPDETVAATADDIIESTRDFILKELSKNQTKKGNEWKFGMKCHIGVDAGSGLVHTMTVTAANEHDITQTANLLREDDEVVYGDSGYIGVQKRPEITNNEHFSNIDFRINRRPSSLPKVSDNAIDWERCIENRKFSVRCKVEHAFRIIKCQFGYKKTVYRGLKKNENRLYAMFTCANLYALAIAERKLSTT